MAIFKFIEKKGFTGKYTIVREYCTKLRKAKIHKTTIRVEYTPKLSAQVDWKEEMVLYSRDPYRFNIFLYVFLFKIKVSHPEFSAKTRHIISMFR